MIQKFFGNFKSKCSENFKPDDFRKILQKIFLAFSKKIEETCMRRNIKSKYPENF